MKPATLPPAALAVLHRLTEAGYEAYVVGGTVRDLLLGREPHDLDVVTNALPEATAALFPHHVAVGAAFGVIGVPTDAGVVDVATYRQESAYPDRRRPAHVQWATLRDDVVRRDLTVNALAYDPQTDQVIDHVDGRRDLELGLIRTVGRATERFHEDPVRMLRAARLRAQLSFQYDPGTHHAIRALAGELRHVAAERVRVELDRMWALSTRVQALTDLDELRLLDVLLPEVSALHGVPQPRAFHREGDVFAHTLAAVAALPAGTASSLVWATLLHDVAKPLVLEYAPRSGQLDIRTPDHARRSAELAGAIAERLRFSSDDRDTVVWLIEHHMSLKQIEAMRPAARERFVLDPRFPLLLELHRADVLGTDPSDLSLYEHDLALYHSMRAAHQQSQTTPSPLVTGHDLMTELGVHSGPEVGRLLELIRDAQLQGEVHTREQALELVRKHRQRP